MPAHADPAIERRIRRANAACVTSAIGLLTLYTSLVVRPNAASMSRHTLLPFAILAGYFVILIGAVVARRAIVRRILWPRCESCNTRLVVSPAWEHNRVSRCPSCGRTTTIAAAP